MAIAKQSQPNLLQKPLTALALLIATSVGATLYQIPTPAQSGLDVILYEGPNFTGRALRLTQGQDSLGSFNNKASSIKVLNNQNWQFWANKNKAGKSITLRPGNYPNLTRFGLNNDIESLKGL